MSLFHSNLRKQIRKLTKILKSVKMSQSYSILFNRVLNDAPVVVARREQLRVRPLQLCLHFLELIVWATGEILLGVALDRTAKLRHLVMLRGLLDEETYVFSNFSSNFWLIVGKL